MDCIDQLGASIDELKASQNKLVELYVATVAERDRLREVSKVLLDCLEWVLLDGTLEKKCGHRFPCICAREKATVALAALAKIEGK